LLGGRDRAGESMVSEHLIDGRGGRDAGQVGIAVLDQIFMVEEGDEFAKADGMSASHGSSFDRNGRI